MPPWEANGGLNVFDLTRGTVSQLASEGQERLLDLDPGWQSGWSSIGGNQVSPIYYWQPADGSSPDGETCDK